MVSIPRLTYVDTIHSDSSKFGHHKTSTQLHTLTPINYNQMHKSAMPKFKENDELSVLSGQDEWNEIEKYNAMAEEHDRQMKLLQVIYLP